MSAHAARQRVSFRSIKEAVEAARDGDQILLLRGIHNGMGYAMCPLHLTVLSLQVGVFAKISDAFCTAFA